ncbi:Mediator of RNA polymerase II transcription subunit 22 [Lucilia cuprina]|nr:Mediator of RNA polymerase II transcription subunit 22 [Lucilia cuprina]
MLIGRRYWENLDKTPEQFLCDNTKENLKIIKLARGEGDSQISKTTQCEQDTYEMQVRAANIVRAGESLMKLVSDIKQYLILNDFHSVNEAIANNSQLFRATQRDCDKKLTKLRDEMAMDLYDLEEEYYTSIFK